MEELQSRIIVAENLPENHCHQNLMKIFSAVRRYRYYYLHAFVEYESVELAEKAVVELNDEGNWRSSLRVRLMLRNAVGCFFASVKSRAKKGHDGGGQCEEDEVYISEMHSNEKQQEDPYQMSDIHSHGNPRSFLMRKREGRRKAPSERVCNEQASIAKQQPPGPRKPDGTRGFAMGRGKPIAVNAG
ncbi:Chloroplast outer envelope protein 37 isoform 1 [Hibiscus syriacus]|uniref:Chloroplast outer envelope protein 37 isoform 1 n=1 Tax=Hibiscus syriacus TaxID=106335 RepID=A0A6A2Z284_HIBSY|nr:Chloroplast outer envelope protein 37 isoform 1 [Hibiscus syriacus]